jgi:hypothetical protein
MRWPARVLTVLMIALPAARGRGADNPTTVPEAAKKAETALVVRVQLGSGQEPADVTLVRVIAGPSSDVDPGSGWLGPCLPSRALLSKWQRQHAGSPARQLWDKALERGTYEATLFMKTQKRRSVRFCEAAPMDMRHTDLHADYAGYVKAVEAAMSRKGAQSPI